MAATYLDRPARPLHIAHRGGALVAPENTLVAFAAAVSRYQTDVLELDVHLSRDGVVVVAHDETLDRCTDASGPVSALTAAELARVDAGYRFSVDGVAFPHRGQGVGVPTLVEVLRAFPGVAFNVELKSEDPDLIRAFVALVRSEDAVGRVCCGSEHDAIAAALADAMPEGTLFYPTQAGAQYVLTVLQGGEPVLDRRYTVLDIPVRYGDWELVTPGLIAAAARHGRWVNVWTVDEEDEMRRLFALGVGGIMTDRPDRLRAVIDGIKA